MPEGSLKGRRVLIVEDDYFMADELRIEFQQAGAEVIGPVGRLSEALELVERDQPIHGAVLDINLAGEAVFDVADALRAMDVPFVFATGYDAETIPAAYSTVRRDEKPIDPGTISKALFR
jgi:DNA-binding response OmpR family regulator